MNNRFLAPRKSRFNNAIFTLLVFLVIPFFAQGQQLESSALTYCEGSGGVTLSTSGLVIGTDYTLKRGDNQGDINIDISTFTANATNFEFPGLFTESYYQLVDENGVNFNSVFIEEIRIYTVTGGGTLCDGSGKPVGLAASQSGVDYELFRDGTSIMTIPGSLGGSSISFSDFDEPGEYTVVAAGPDCTVDMDGSAIIANRPTTSFSFDPSNGCASTVFEFTSTAIDGIPPYTYVWVFGADAPISTTNPVLNHSFNAIGDGSQVININHYVIDANSCESIHESTNITISEVPDASLTPNPGWNGCNVGGTYDLTVTNTSTTAATNTSYTIDWGDSSPSDVFDDEFTVTSHTYTNPGSYELTLTVVGANLCEATLTETVFFGTNPTGGISIGGSITGCSPLNVDFTLTNDVELNPLGTSYNIDFGDEQTLYFEQEELLNYWDVGENKYIINHTYVESSCNENDNGFSIKITIENPCSEIFSTTGPVKVSTPAVPDFMRGAFPNDPIITCVNSNVTFVNETVEGCLVIGDNTTNATNYYWDFDYNGTFNSDIEDVDPTYAYSTPGSYTIKMIAHTAENEAGDCGEAEITREVCVQQIPEPSFIYDMPPTPCVPFSIDLVNTSNYTSCAEPEWVWNISPATGVSFTNGTDATSKDPSLLFSSSGTYTVTLIARTYTNGVLCNEVLSTNEVLILTTEPEIIVQQDLFEFCGSGTISFNDTHVSYTDNGSAITDYEWILTKPDNSTVTYNQAYPTINFDQIGTYTLSVGIENICGIASPGLITVVVAPLISDNTISSATSEVCVGEILGNLITGNLPSGGGGNYIYEWYIDIGGGWQQLTGENGQNLNYQEALTQNPTRFRRRVNAAICDQESNIVEITVNPNISDNFITNNTTHYVCTGFTPEALIGSTPTGGSGLYNYLWEISTDEGVNWSPAPGINTNIDYSFPDVITQTTWIRRRVESGTCETISGSVEIFVYSNILNNSVASATVVQCAGFIPDIITGTSPTQNGNTNFTYQWQSSSDGINFADISGAIGQNYQPDALTETTWFRRVVNAAIPVPFDCNSDQSAAVEIVVHENPLANAGGDFSINYGTTTTLNGSASNGTPGYSYSWSGPVINPNNAVTLTQQLTSQTTFTLTVTDQEGCVHSDDAIISILGGPLQVSIDANPDQICLGSSSIVTANATGGNDPNYSYSWSSNPPGTYPPSSSITVFPTETTDYTVQVNDGFNTDQETYTLVVNNIPTITSSNFISVCSGESTNYTIEASNAPGTTFTWTVTDPSGACVSGESNGNGNLIDQTLINSCNNYVDLIYTITPTGPAPASCQGADFELTVRVRPQFTSSYADKTINTGTSTTIDGSLAGGTPVYSYTWEPAAMIAGATNIANPSTVILTNNQTFTLTAIDNSSCIFTQDIDINVTGSALAANITSDANNNELCEGEPVVLSANASGGSGTYSYVWSGIPAGATTSGNTATFIPQNIGNNNYSVTVDDGFTTVSNNITISVNQLPQITSSEFLNVCSGSAFSYDIISDVAGSTYEWTASPIAAGCISGHLNGSGDQINQILFNNCANPVNVVYSITPTGPGTTNCVGNPFELTVTVNPAFDNTYQDVTINMGTSTTINGSISGGTLPYNFDWQPTALIEGSNTISNPTTQNLFNPQVFTLDLTDNQGCTYILSVTVTPTGAPLSVIISSDGSNDEICEDGIITLTANAAGGSENYTYDWPDLPAGATVNGNIASFTPENIGQNQYSVIVDDGYNTITENIIIISNQIPQVTSLSSISTCAGSTVNYLPESNVNNSTFTWTSTSNPNVNGNSASGSGVINDILSNNTTSVQSVNYLVTPIGSAPTFCTGQPFAVAVNVNPVPSVTNIENTQSVISQQSSIEVPFTSDVNGVVFNWTSTSSCPGEINYPEVSGSGIIPAQIIAINPGGPQSCTITYEVIPEINGCPGNPFYYNIVVNTAPSIFNFSGTVSICNGEATTLTLDGSEVGISYQLMKDGFPSQTPKNGDGNPLTWTVSASGNYQVIATNTNSGLSETMLGTAIVTVEALPISFNLYIQQPGDHCLPIIPWLNGSQSGAIYELSRTDFNGTLFSNIQQLVGTGSPLTFSTQTEPGYYTVTAYLDHGTITCPQQMNGTIEAFPLPFEYTVSPQGVLCEDIEEVCLSGSELGVEYQLWLNNQPIGNIVIGDGNPICLGPLNEPGLYSIWANNPATLCESFYQYTFQVEPLPEVYTVAPVAGCEGTEIVLNNCQAGIDYYLYFEPATNKNREFVQVAGPLNCAGGILSFGIQFNEGTYFIEAVNPTTNCSSIMDGTTEIYPNPEVFAMNPQGTACGPQEIYLNNFEVDATYFLYRGNTLVASIAGSTGSVNFGEQTIPGIYTIRAQFNYPEVNCVETMQGTLEIITSPQQFTLLPINPSCPPTTFNLSGSEIGINYHLWHDSFGERQVIAGTGGIVYFAEETEPGSYWVVAESVDNCETQMTGTRVIYSTPTQYDITPDAGQWCNNQPVDIGLANSEIGFTYELHRIGSATNPQASVSGTGTAISFGTYTNIGTYRVKGINDVSLCEAWMLGQVSLNNPPNIYNVTANGTIPLAGWYCPPVEIGIDLSQVGVNYTLHSPDGNTFVEIGTGAAISFGDHIYPGEYSITAFNPTTSCSSDMSGIIMIYEGPEIFELSSLTLPEYCEGDLAAIDLILNYSSLNVSYQLYKNDLLQPILPPVIGTGSALSWTEISQFGAGSYFVIASFIDDPTCSSQMNGIINVEEVQLPIASLSGIETICESYCTDLVFNITASKSFTITYTANNLLQPPVSFNVGDDYSIQVCPSVSTIYEIQSIEYTEFPYCTGTDITGTFEVIVEPLPAITFNNPGTTCITTPVMTNVLTSNASAYDWIIISGNGTISPNNTENVTYTPSVGDEGTTVVLQLTAWGMNTCSNESVSEFIEIEVEPIPAVDMGADGLICETGTYTTSTTIDFGSTYQWEIVSGNGTINPIDQQNTTYTAAPGDGGTTVQLQLTVEGESSCLNESVSDFLDIIIEPLPTADAGIGGTICESEIFQLNGSATNQTTVLWEIVNGVGTFDDASILNPVFTPGDVGNNTSMTLRLSAFGSGSCNGEIATSDVIINVEPLPEANAGLGGIICETQGYHFANASVQNNSTFVWEIEDGSGHFDDQFNLSPVFYPDPVNQITDMTLRLVAYGLNNCSTATDISLVTITVYPQPLANAGNGGETCVSLPFALTDATAEHQSSVLWEVVSGEGFIDSPLNVNPNYIPVESDAGSIVTLKLTAFGDGPCSMISTNDFVNIFIQGLPTVNAGSNLQTCFSDAVTITQASAENYEQILWTHDGNGILNNNTTINPTYIPQPGDEGNTITLTLTAQGLDACTGEIVTDQTTIFVDPLPVAFAGIDATICELENYTILDASATFESSVFWSVINGSGSITEPFQVNTTYIPDASDAGTTVLLRLTVYGSGNCSAYSTFDEINISVIESPIALFSVDSPVCENELVSFTDQSSTPAGIIEQWVWDFGDGSAPITIDFPNNPNASHSYALSGVYTVSLIVTTTNGCTDTYSTVIEIGPAPVAAFDYSGGFCAENEVDFIDLSQENGGGNIASWFWDFGDGTSSTEQNPTHIFNIAADYDVSLIVTNTENCVSQPFIQTITIGEPITVNIDDTDLIACLDDPHQFNGISPEAVYWNWDFGDGTTSTLQNPTHTYTSTGNYTVTLIGEDINGCQNVDEALVTVSPNPQAFFSSEQSACTNEQISFTDASTSPNGQITEWLWDMGDGTVIGPITNPADRNIVYQYVLAGSYEVELTVTDINGCTDTFSRILIIENEPLANFIYDAACEDQAVIFTDLSSPNSGSDLFIWQWNFGDPASGANNSSNIQNPSHRFIGDMPAGGFTVTLTVTNTQGCTDTYQTQVELTTPQTITISSDQNPICLGDPIQFSSDATNVQSWLWNFGDGNTSTQANPSHSYQFVGNYNVTLDIQDVNGCLASANHLIEVNDLPTANFENTAPGCPDETIYFTDLSISPNGGIANWLWDFGDGNTVSIDAPNDPDVEHIYANTGTYNITLTVTDITGCEDSFTRQIVTENSPLANFNFTQTCFGEPVLFTDLSSPNGGSDLFSWLWEFGDQLSGINNTSTLQNPSHVFTAPGVYTVSLTVTNTQGCVSTFEADVTVNETVDIDFETAATAFCPGETIDFTPIGDDMVSYEWDFGDGGTSIQQTPQYIYSLPGTYTVSLLVTAVDGCQGYVEHDVVINEEPVAAFSTDSPSCSGAPTQFFNASSSPTGFITEWIWNFGDGSPDVIVAFPDNPDVEYSYPNEGTYNATLTVTNSNGCFNSISHEVIVAPGPVAAFDFSGSCAESPVSFTDLSQENGGGIITDWQWNFGDLASGTANTSTLQNPEHSFTAPGNYDVELIITNINGCTSTVTNTITIDEALLVEITADNATLCLGTPVNFTGTAAGAVIWNWDFGDGNTATVQNPSHTYTATGIFTVSLTAETPDGCYNTATLDIEVNPTPIARFTDSGPTCSSDSVYFTSLSTTPNGFIQTHIWDMNDGTVITVDAPDDPNIAHLYANPGTYEVSLTVIDNVGCENTSTRLVQVEASPIADFSSGESCFGAPVFFTDLTSPNGGPDLFSWQWWFGDPTSGINNTSTLQNPTHLFSSEGTFDVTLVVTNTIGCSDTVENQVTVNALPEVDFTIANDSICLNTAAEFTGIGVNINTWFWEFGDGGSSIQQSPSYTYAEPGHYDVTLTVTNINQCQNSITQSIFVNDAPIADFSLTNGCLGDSTYFIDETVSLNGLIELWEWDFGDGNTANVQNPAHLYADADDYLVTLTATDNFGCSESISRWVSIYEKPIAAFSYNQVCDPSGQVFFFNESESSSNGSPILEFEWNFHDGYFSNEINPNHIFPETDTCYVVSLTITDAFGCDSTVTDTICIWEPLSVDFTATEECLGLPTFFEASYLPEDDSIVSYAWNFNDGSNIFLTYRDTTSHVFPNAGTYFVELTTTNLNGCENTIYREVVVNGLPLPDFSYEPGLCDDPVAFTDLTDGNGALVENWFWDFGDPDSGPDNFSTLQSPTHLYSDQGGVYQVKLIVTNFNGCTDSITKEVIQDPCVQASFIAPSITLCADSTICFTENSYIAVADGSIDRWIWNFGDNTPDYEYTVMENPVCHTFEGREGGEFVVSLTIEATVNGSPFTDTHTETITIYPKPSARFIPAPVCQNTDAVFTDNSAGNGLPITSWFWDFGDLTTLNDTSSNQNPAYRYPDYGLFDVQLVVTNEFDCSDTLISEIEIYQPPTADFIAVDSCVTYITYFNDLTETGGAPIDNYFWHFGDPASNSDDGNPWTDSTSTERWAEHIYNNAGTYFATLVVEDENSCRDTVRHSLPVHPIPNASFIFEDRYEGRQGQVFFESTSDATASSFFWDFMTGDTSDEENPVYQFEEDGLYDVMLVAYNDHLCPDTAINQYEIIFTGLYFPNTFVPNSDDPEVNNFKGLGENLETYNLEVYTSWGQLIWSSSALEDGKPLESWDGTYNNQDLPTGSYIWKASATFKDGTMWEGSDNGDGNLKTYGILNLIR